MKNRLEIFVTREDLKKPYSDPCNCPIATALKREVVNIDKERLRIYSTTALINGEKYTFNRAADMKALSRSRSFIGHILGGFKVVLTK